ARASGDLRQGAAVPGQAGRATTRLAGGGVRAVRREGHQDDQDVSGHLETGRRRDPGSGGQGGGRLGGFLLHQAGGNGRGGSGGGGGPQRPGADEQGRQGGMGSGPAAGAQPFQQRGLLQLEPVDVQPGGGVGLGQARRGVGEPGPLPVGQRAAAAFASGQTEGLAAAGCAGRNRRGSGRAADQGGLPRPGPAVA